MDRDEDIRMHPSHLCAQLQRPGCLVPFRLIPFGPRDPARRPFGPEGPPTPSPFVRIPPARAAKAEGGRGSKEAGGGGAAPCVLRSITPPPADPHGRWVRGDGTRAE